MKQIYLIFFLVLTSNLFAELHFPQTLIEAKLKDSDLTAVIPIKYENVGQKIVKINSIKTTCGCTTAVQKTDLIKPGESGEIIVTYTKGSSYGVQTKSVIIDTDDDTEPLKKIDLKFEMSIPLILTNQQISWAHKQQLSKQEIHIKINEGYGSFNIIGVNSTNEDYLVSLKTIKPKSEYLIIVTPLQTDYPSKATIRIETDNNAPRIFYAYAQVTPP